PLDAIGRARPLAIRKAPPAANDLVYVVHHPTGKPKQISIECPVAEAEHAGWKPGSGLTEFTHRCDTEAGSSGAPVLDAKGDIVGLHHLGFELDPVTCKQKDRVNKAVRMDKILDYLRDNNLDVYKRLTLH